MVYQRRRTLVVTLILATFFTLILSSACAPAMKPEIRSITLDWGEVTSATTEVIATVKVFNPNPFSLPVKKVTCRVTMAGIPLATAETVDLKIEKNAELPIKISAKIDNSKIPDFWVQHLKNQEKSMALIDLEVTFNLIVTDFTFSYQFKTPIETDLLASLKEVGPIPIEKTVEVPVIRLKITIFKVTIESLSGKWGQVSPDSTELNLFATILNENPYPLAAPKVAYNITMNNISLASGETEANYFAPNSKNDITTKVSLDTLLMDEWFVSHVRQGEKSTFNIKIALVFELPREVAQAIGQDKLTIPVWETDEEFETHIMPQSIKF